MNCQTTCPPSFNIAPPEPSACNSAAGTVENSGNAVQSLRYPTTSMGFTVPAVNGLTQFSVAGASGWAQPGLLIWLPSHGGYLSIVGNSGDLVTARNLTVPVGSIISTGTPLVPTAPPQATPEGQVSTVTAVSSLAGNFQGLPVQMNPVLGAVLIGTGAVWSRLNASILLPTPTLPTLVDVKRDVLASTFGTTATARWANPVWGGAANSPAPATVTFPQFPTVPAGLQLRALVQCDWKIACLVAGTLCVEVTINGITSKVVQYCSQVNQGLGTLPANIRHEGPSGHFNLIIPVPSDNAAVNVSTYVRKNELTSGDANTHYIFNYKVLGYYVG
jgi:hypothetical protein